MSTVMLGFGVVVDYAVPEVPVVLDSMAGAAVI
jgi:hypothetical protein